MLTRDAVLDFSETGNGRNFCFNCGSEFQPDFPDENVVPGDTVPCHCPDCGGRCANPVVVGD